MHRSTWVSSLPLALSVAFVASAAFLVRGAPTDVSGLEVATAEDVVDAINQIEAKRREA